MAVARRMEKDRVPDCARVDESPPPEQTIIERIAAGVMTFDEVTDAIINEAYGPLRLFCELPAGYRHCTLESMKQGIDSLPAEKLDELVANPPGVIVDPDLAQLEAIGLLQLFVHGDSTVCLSKDPFRPLFGANFFGPPGCGKTHLLAAFARQMKLLLDVKLESYRTMVRKFVVIEYGKLVKKSFYAPSRLKMQVTDDPEAAERLRQSLDSNGDNFTPLLQAAAVAKEAIENNRVDEVVTQDELRARFLGALEKFKQSLRKLEYQPSDLLYLTFDQLFELCHEGSENRKVAFEALAKAKLVFIDDVHPKGDPERAQVVQAIIEERYALGKMGTFITTNLTTDEIGGDDERIASRLKSRCSEMFYEINFADCVDWRVKVKRRRVDLVKQMLNERIRRADETPFSSVDYAM